MPGCAVMCNVINTLTHTHTLPLSADHTVLSFTAHEYGKITPKRSAGLAYEIDS